MSDAAASPTSDSLEVIRKFAETYAQRTGTYFCSDPGVTAVVLEGLAGRGDAASVAFNLQALQQCGSALRDRLSNEHWRLVSGLHEGFLARLRPALDQPAGARLSDALPLADAVSEMQHVTSHIRS